VSRSSLNVDIPGWWERHRLVVFRVLTVLMAVLATLKIADEFRRLVFDQNVSGAIDLRHMHRWVGIWFAGKGLFQMGKAALYPPATYLMLWPLLGWTSIAEARWLWAVLSVIALFVISLLFIRVIGAKSRAEKVFAVLIVLSINGMGVAIGNGQFILLVLPALMGATLLIEPRAANISRDVMAGALLTWTLVKPSLALPFIWVFLFRDKHWRAVVAATIFYILLTFASAAAQNDNLPVLLGAMFHRAAVATVEFAGTRNLHAMLITLGHPEWITFSSVIVFIALGIWIFLRRRADIWILIGVSALVARMWTYHRVYDDALIMLAELALWRIARTSASLSERATAEILLVSKKRSKNWGIPKGRAEPDLSFSELASSISKRANSRISRAVCG